MDQFLWRPNAPWPTKPNYGGRPGCPPSARVSESLLCSVLDHKRRVTTWRGKPGNVVELPFLLTSHWRCYTVITDIFLYYIVNNISVLYCQYA